MGVPRKKTPVIDDNLDPVALAESIFLSQLRK